MFMKDIYDTSFSGILIANIDKNLKSVKTKAAILKGEIEKGTSFKKLKTKDKELFEREYAILLQYQEILEEQIKRQHELHDPKVKDMSETISNLLTQITENFPGSSPSYEYNKDTDEYFISIRDHSLYRSKEYLSLISSLKFDFLLKNGITNVLFSCDES